MKVSKVDVGRCESVVKFIVANVGQILEKVCAEERCASLQDFFLKFFIILMLTNWLLWCIDAVKLKITDLIVTILGLCDCFSDFHCARGLSIRSNTI